MAKEDSKEMFSPGVEIVNNLTKESLDTLYGARLTTKNDLAVIAPEDHISKLSSFMSDNEENNGA